MTICVSVRKTTGPILWIYGKRVSPTFPSFRILTTSDDFYVTGRCGVCCVPETQVKVRHIYLSCVTYIFGSQKPAPSRVCAHGILLSRLEEYHQVGYSCVTLWPSSPLCALSNFWRDIFSTLYSMSCLGRDIPDTTLRTLAYTGLASTCFRG